jgi:hypothetical protein
MHMLNIKFTFVTCSGVGNYRMGEIKIFKEWQNVKKTLVQILDYEKEREEKKNIYIYTEWAKSRYTVYLLLAHLVYIYMYMCVCVCVCVYIYIYIRYTILGCTETSHRNIKKTLEIYVTVCGGSGGSSGDAPRFHQANRTSSKDKTDKQNGEKKYITVLSASSCHDKDHTSMLGMVLNIKLLIRKTYQHSWGTEHVTEWVIYQVEEGGRIQVSIPHNLGGEESLARSTPK